MTNSTLGNKHLWYLYLSVQTQDSHGDCMMHLFGLVILQGFRHCMAHEVIGAKNYIFLITAAFMGKKIPIRAYCMQSKINNESSFNES